MLGRLAEMVGPKPHLTQTDKQLHRCQPREPYACEVDLIDLRHSHMQKTFGGKCLWHSQKSSKQGWSCMGQCLVMRQRVQLACYVCMLLAWAYVFGVEVSDQCEMHTSSPPRASLNL